MKYRLLIALALVLSHVLNAQQIAQVYTFGGVLMNSNVPIRPSASLVDSTGRIWVASYSDGLIYEYDQTGVKTGRWAGNTLGGNNTGNTTRPSDLVQYRYVSSTLNAYSITHSSAAGNVSGSGQVLGRTSFDNSGTIYRNTSSANEASLKKVSSIKFYGTTLTGGVTKAGGFYIETNSAAVYRFYGDPWFNNLLLTSPTAITNASITGFISPQALALTPNRDRLAVTDRGARQVKLFDLNGNLLNTITRSAGKLDGQFNTIAGIAFDARNQIYVADSNRVHVFSANGNWITDWELDAHPMLINANSTYISPANLSSTSYDGFRSIWFSDSHGSIDGKWMTAPFNGQLIKLWAFPIIDAVNDITPFPSQKLTLTGFNLFTLSALGFNGTWAPVTTLTSDVITVTVPIGATSGALSFKTLDGQQFTSGFNITIQKLNQTGNLQVDPIIQYSNSSSAVVTVSSGLPVELSSSNSAVLSISGNSIIARSVGTATITAVQPGNSIWNPITLTSQITVTPLFAYVIPTSIETVFNNTIEPQWSIIGMLPQDNYTGVPQWSIPNNLNVGNYTITGSLGTLTSPNYLFSVSDLLVSVLPATQSLNLSSISTVLSDTVQILQASSSSGALVNIELLSGPAKLNGNRLVVTTASGVVQLKFSSSAPNYLPVSSIVGISFDLPTSLFGGNLSVPGTVPGTVTGVELSDPASSITVYPNPAQGVVFLNGLPYNAAIQIYNATTGQTQPIKLETEGELQRIYLNSPGLFIIKINNNIYKILNE